jgi:hypothetical protein
MIAGQPPMSEVEGSGGDDEAEEKVTQRRSTGGAWWLLRRMKRRDREKPIRVGAPRAAGLIPGAGGDEVGL